MVPFISHSGLNKQWGYYTAAVGAIYTDVTTPVSFSRCFFAASIDILLAASTTWPGTTQTVWNINASTANKLRFIWAKAPIELDGAVWFGIFIQTVGISKAVNCRTSSLSSASQYRLLRLGTQYPRQTRPWNLPFDFKQNNSCRCSDTCWPV